MTNDLHEVLNANSQTISSYTEVLKAIFLFLQSLGPVAGSIVGGGVPIIGLIATWLIKRNTSATTENTKVTKVNTTVSTKYSDKFDAQKTAIDNLVETVNELKKSFESLEKSVEKTLNDRSDRIEIGLMKYKTSSDQKLSGITSVQKAIEARVTVTEKNIGVIVEGLKKFGGGNHDK